MDLKSFNLIYFVITAFVIVWILYNRKSFRPSRLNLRASTGNLPQVFRKKQGHEKSLDCFFVYNGHEFNAYEVLGIPAGASVTMAKQAYETLEKTQKNESDFYRAALSAILNK